MTKKQQVGRYQLLYEIDAGGMGTVYRGRDTDLDRTVAVKMLSSSAFSGLDGQLRFIQEAKIVAKLDHPNINKIYGIEYTENNVYLIMEYLDGDLLSSLMHHKRCIPLNKCLSIMEQLAKALSHAHGRGVVHLDIKPDNIMVGRDETVKLMDFGIAHDKAADFNLPSSQEMGMGTPKYMSPEQFHGSAVDLRSDIYSFGVVFYEMLAGRPPFEAKDTKDYQEYHCHTEPPILEKFRSDLPAEVVAYVYQCLAKDPKKRPGNLDKLPFKVTSNKTLMLGPSYSPIKSRSPSKKVVYSGLGFAGIIILALVTGFLWFGKSEEENLAHKNKVIPAVKTDIQESVPVSTQDASTVPTGLPEETISSRQESQGLASENPLHTEQGSLDSERPVSSIEVPIKDPSFHLLEEEDWIALARGINQFENIKALSSKEKSRARREQALQVFLWESHENLLLLIPFLKAEDKTLVKNISYLLGIRNIRSSLSTFQKRLRYEEDEHLKIEIYRAIAYFITDATAEILNKGLLDNIENKNIQKNLLPCISGKANPDVIKIVSGKLSSIKDPLLKLRYQSLLASMGDSQYEENAKRILHSGTPDEMIEALGIFQFSQDASLVTLLRGERRKFYKTVPLFNAYLQTKAILAAHSLEGKERYSAMAKECEKNEMVLAWLSLYVAKENTEWGHRWLLDFFKKFAYRKYRDSIRAYHIFMMQAVNEEKLSGGMEHSSIPTFDVELTIASELDRISVILDNVKMGRGMTHQKSFFKDSCNLIIQTEEGIRYEHRVSLRKGEKQEIRITSPPLKWTNSLGMSFQYVMPEPFRWTEIGDLSPVIRISNPYYMSLFETTNDQFEKFNKDHFERRDKYSSLDNQPVVMITWEEAVKFCNWLSQAENRQPAYTSSLVLTLTKDGYRIPTEMEWIFAAWGNEAQKSVLWQTSIENKTFLRGNIDSPDDHDYSAPVGSYLPNALGFYDMWGNVAEWCHDWYVDYNVEKPGKGEWKFADHPIGAEIGSFRVLRGGSWYMRDSEQCFQRDFANPYEKSQTRGFRVCMTTRPYVIEIKRNPEKDTEKGNL